MYSANPIRSRLRSPTIMSTSGQSEHQQQSPQRSAASDIALVGSRSNELSLLTPGDLSTGKQAFDAQSTSLPLDAFVCGGRSAAVTGTHRRRRRRQRKANEPSSPVPALLSILILLGKLLLTAVDWFLWHTASARVDWILNAAVHVRHFFRPDPVLPWSDAALEHQLKRHRFGAVTATVFAPDAVRVKDIDSDDVAEVGPVANVEQERPRIVRGCQCARCHARIL
ncbi:hypothetical protein BCR44DRAFT_69821 [Catenaria anguillulae PL171]|uniref:Uncharacterized protein n=1 Tax=Catenaria anguillulae PL171 TaxID=765915 RepID=A0A1Y2HQA9_9FUNG|nr:hypothetical protein BCR44DRAFT_69821 [Catenaria anguillulae PL171]